MSLRLYLVLAAALALGGCNNQAADKDPAQADSDSNPNYKQAQQDLDNNNPQGAVADYQAALGANPKLPGAHYELGMIYANKLNDPISAIYHFKRFLELSPNTDKKDQVQAIIDKQGSDYASSLPNAGPSPDDMSKLQADNASLKKEVDDANNTISQLQAKLTQRAAEAAAAPAPSPVEAPAPSAVPVVADESGVPATAAPPTTAAPVGPERALPVDQATAALGNAGTDSGSTSTAPISTAGARSYTVVKGDSYWRISKKMYPHDTKNGVAKIQEANKQTMSKPLKIGQVLVIPQ
jgi:tetratricopeptide (TPR) repeat protein